MDRHARTPAQRDEASPTMRLFADPLRCLIFCVGAASPAAPQIQPNVSYIEPVDQPPSRRRDSSLCTSTACETCAHNMIPIAVTIDIKRIMVIVQLGHIVVGIPSQRVGIGAAGGKASTSSWSFLDCTHDKVHHANAYTITSERFS